MMRILYDLLFYFVLLVTSPVWVYRLVSTGKWRTDWGARFGRVDFKDDGRPVLLVHGVSVGEVNALRQMVDHVDRLSDGKVRVVVSTTTDTGFKRAKEVFEPRVTVVRYPFDVTFSVRRFLDVVKPKVVALGELEVWPNFVAHCAERGVPVCVVNGRLSARSFKKYKWIRFAMGKTFARLQKVSAQTEAYAGRFKAMGTEAGRVHVGDTMKWDTANVSDTVPGSEALAKALGLDLSKPIVVAGSTAPGEDVLLRDACPEGVQLVIVPRKPEWFDEVERNIPGVVRRTRNPEGSERAVDGARFFLLDTVGELRKAYALADVVVVGRSFGKLYGSDMMEPVALGKPTVIGPRYSDFQDTMDALLAVRGIVVTSEPGKVIRELLADKEKAKRLGLAGRAVVLSRRGASLRNAQMLLEEMKRVGGLGAGGGSERSGA
jgi:3-deoxy-D-manno-octulosonic-acid transferase